MCVEYGVTSVSVWKDLLKQMIASSSRDSDLLESTFNCLIHNPALVKVRFLAAVNRFWYF